jgi:hypothetical protein
MQIFNIHTEALRSKTMGGVSRTNDVPYTEYVLSFLKNKSVQQPVHLPNINENQTPYYMHIFYI